MKKLFAIITLIATLMAASIADAKFSDEYRAKYPKRVKVETDMFSSGKTYTRTTYKLFKHTINDVTFSIVLTVSDDIIKMCHFSAGTITDRPAGLTRFTWGDGQTSHNIKALMSYTERKGRGRFFNFLSSNVTGAELKEMKNAVAFSIQGPGGQWSPILYPSHKYWKEWQEAIDAAEKIMNERYKRPVYTGRF